MSREIVQRIFSLYREKGGRSYTGEPVTILEHSIQCAMAAERDGASNETILGAFLHDIGHLLDGDSEMVTDGLLLGTDSHEKIGAKFLEQLQVPPDVTRIVRHHVDAKRYLTYKSPEYHKALSIASKMTLVHQGGPMSQTEAEEFERQPHFQLILDSRRWDEQAKEGGLELKPLSTYESMLGKLMREVLKE